MALDRDKLTFNTLHIRAGNALVLQCAHDMFAFAFFFFFFSPKDFVSLFRKYEYLCLNLPQIYF